MKNPLKKFGQPRIWFRTAARMNAECSPDEIELMAKSRKFGSVYGTLKPTTKVLSVYNKMMRRAIFRVPILIDSVNFCLPLSGSVIEILFSGAVMEIVSNPIMDHITVTIPLHNA